ncbi:AraC family transcriptional regulator [Nakamurella silvestris]|nr:AraC family transcriptional regulator [Nakamurella silvestris]
MRLQRGIADYQAGSHDTEGKDRCPYPPVDVDEASSTGNDGEDGHGQDVGDGSGEHVVPEFRSAQPCASSSTDPGGVGVPGTFMTVAVDLPIVGHYLPASITEPYLGFALTLRPSTIAELLLKAPKSFTNTQENPPPGLTINTATPQVLDAIARLLSLIERPGDARVLAPLYEREILWEILSGPAGAAVRQIGLSDSSLTHIGRAIRYLRTHAFEPVQIGDLAKLSGMGVSSFHKQFRTMTEMTPIQYQKKIRLQEARLQLLQSPNDVTTIGHSVGSSSASQFSREYRREFGVPPSDDAVRMREVV